MNFETYIQNGMGYDRRKHRFVDQNVKIAQEMHRRIRKDLPDELLIATFKPIITVTAEGKIEGDYWKWSRERKDYTAF